MRKLWRFGKQPEVPAARRGVIAPLRMRSLSLHILPVTIALLAVLHVTNTLFVFHFYRLNAAHERETREATATLLAEQASHAFTAIDLTLQTISARLVGDVAQNRATILDQAMIGAESIRLAQVRQIFVVDKAGMLLLDSKQYPANRRDLSDRPYFTAQIKRPEQGLFIGALITRAPNQKPHFSMSRGINSNNGELVGVAVVLVEPSYFSGFYALSTSDSIESEFLLRDDGTILASNLPQAFDEHSRIADFLSGKSDDVVSVRDVTGFPLRLVVTSLPALSSPGFRNFIAIDGPLMALVTLIALWLARILAEEARARATAENRLQSAIEAAPGALALFDSDDRLVLCNQQYVEFYPDQIQPLLVSGTRFESLIHAMAASGGYGESQNPEISRQTVEQRLKAHQDATGEIVQQLTGGRWVLTRERKTKEGGTVCFHTDITKMKQQEHAFRKSEQAERQAREAAERADRTKSSFLATMSHELRTPLNAVIGFSQIMEKGIFGPQPARYREYATLIRRSGEHLLTIINDILDIAKLQSGKTELHLEIAPLDAIIEESVRLMEAQAKAANITLSCRIGRDIPPVHADLTRLRQVVLNLLSNAIKFTPNGGKVSIEANVWEGAVMITVTDTGIGMAEKDIPRALEPFGQISNTMTRAHEGTGLGLPLSKSLIELHGGHFEIKSAPGIGTAITITLPAVIDEQSVEPEAAWRGVG
jgi:two-component system cell cycle sensor histidine kinase PleC